MIKPTPISGFPEWLPAQRLAEKQIIDTISKVYELYGYTNLETSAVERVNILGAKGEVDKEVYALGRLQGRPEQHWELALHFDLTVPLARYVAQNYGSLTFPFKRYQIQKVWRGERPQEGRFREFYQADIDVIGEEKLPLHFDAEMPEMIAEIFRNLGIRAVIHINNRKVLLGYYQHLNMSQELYVPALREIDKLDKIGPEKVKEALIALGISQETADKCLALSAVKGPGSVVLEQAKNLNVDNELFNEGIKEIEYVSNCLSHLEGQIEFNFGIVRGLDYYTGTIYETTLPDYPSLGSICSGGRYDNLASEFINRKLPGVGISIGLSRLLAYLFSSGNLKPTKQTPTEVLITYPDVELHKSALEIALYLRKQGIPTEVFHECANLKKQMRYADRKGIPYVIFPHLWDPETQTVEVKELATTNQEEITLPLWCKKFLSLKNK